MRLLLAAALTVAMAGCAGLPVGNQDCGGSEHLEIGDDWASKVQAYTEGQERRYSIFLGTPTEACEKQHVRYQASARVSGDAVDAGCPNTNPAFRVSWNHEGLGGESGMTEDVGAGVYFAKKDGEVGLAQHKGPVSLTISTWVAFAVTGTPAAMDACHLPRIQSMTLSYDYLKPSGMGTG